MHEPKGMFIGRCLFEGLREARCGVSYIPRRDRFCSADLTIRSVPGRVFDPVLEAQTTYLLHDPDKLRAYIFRYANGRKPWLAKGRIYIGLEDNGRNTGVLTDTAVRELVGEYTERAPRRGHIDHLEILSDGTATWRDPKQHLRHLYERRAFALNGPRSRGVVTRVNGAAFFVEEQTSGKDRERLIYYTSLEKGVPKPMPGAVVSFKLFGKTNRGVLVGEYAKIV